MLALLVVPSLSHRLDLSLLFNLASNRLVAKQDSGRNSYLYHVVRLSVLLDVGLALLERLLQTHLALLTLQEQRLASARGSPVALSQLL